MKKICYLFGILSFVCFYYLIPFNYEVLDRPETGSFDLRFKALDVAETIFIPNEEVLGENKEIFFLIYVVLFTIVVSIRLLTVIFFKTSEKHLLFVSFGVSVLRDTLVLFLFQFLFIGNVLLFILLAIASFFMMGIIINEVAVFNERNHPRDGNWNVLGSLRKLDREWSSYNTYLDKLNNNYKRLIHENS